MAAPIALLAFGFGNLLMLGWLAAAAAPGLVSTSVTASPALAALIAMPLPIVPAPMTPMRRISRAPSVGAPRSAKNR